MALIGAIDQGTSSTRFLIFDARNGKRISEHQVELKHIYPKEGWVEMEPTAIAQSTFTCIDEACSKLASLGVDIKNMKAIGITNQRETTIAWNRETGEAFYNAVVWMDMRTESLVDECVKKLPFWKRCGGKNAFSKITGLPIHPYFSALKIRWMLDNVPEVKKAAEKSLLCFGTVDTWLIWNLTKGKSFVTDVTNASRTNLMDLRTLKWDKGLLKFYGIDERWLAEIRSSAEIYGRIMGGVLTGVPISGCLGDQQAALVGEGCLAIGSAKSTYGTGCFMLMNTGTNIAYSKYGLLTTVGYKLGATGKTVYALEGSVAVAGIVVRWLRDQLGVITTSNESEELAKRVVDTGGVYFVPAFSGLYAPYWHLAARGIICGLTQYTNKAHIVRAALESVCFQTREIVDAMEKDTNTTLKELKVDGGMVKNTLFLQSLAEIVNRTIVRSEMEEASCLGAAAAAGWAIGVWNLEKLMDQGITHNDRFIPTIRESDRNYRYAKWKNAVLRSMNWIDDGDVGTIEKNSIVLKDQLKKHNGLFNFGRWLIEGLIIGAITAVILQKYR